MLALDIVYVNSLVLAQSCTRLGSFLLLFSATRLGSTLLILDRTSLDLALSVQSLTCLGLAASILQFASVGSFTSLRGFVQVGSFLSISGLTRPEPVFFLSVVAAVHLGFPLSPRSRACLGLAVPLVHAARLGSFPLVRNSVRTDPLMLMIGLCRLGFVSPPLVVDSTHLGPSSPARSFVQLDLALLVIDLVAPGLFLLTQSFGHIDLALFIFDATHLDFTSSVRQPAHLDFSASTVGLARTGFVSSLLVVDSAFPGPAVSIRRERERVGVELGAELEGGEAVDFGGFRMVVRCLLGRMEAFFCILEMFRAREDIMFAGCFLGYLRGYFRHLKVETSMKLEASGFEALRTLLIIVYSAKRGFRPIDCLLHLVG